MFAGLPGIGVGTLFYVLTALWMPIRELGRLLRGDVSAERWRLVLVQFCFALSIIASVAIADRLLVLILHDGSFSAISPARLINEGFVANAPESFWAAPVFASLLLLAVVLVFAELVRLALLVVRRPRRQRITSPVYSDEPANS